MAQPREYTPEHLSQPIGERLTAHWTHYQATEPPDTRPLDDPNWQGFQEFVLHTEGVRGDLITRDGFAKHGYILWAAYLAGTESRV